MSSFPASKQDVEDALADWLADANGAIPGNLVDDIAAKLVPDGVTLDSKIGPVDAYPPMDATGLAGGIDHVRDLVEQIKAAVAALPAGGGTTTDDLQTWLDARIGHFDAGAVVYSPVADQIIPALQIVADLVTGALLTSNNGHHFIQAAIGDDVFDHQPVQQQLDALVSLVTSDPATAHATLQQQLDAIEGLLDNPDTGMGAVQAAIEAHIDTHDAGVKAALDAAQAELDSRIDGVTAGVGALIDTHDGTVATEIAGAVETLASDVITARNVLTGWIDDAVAHFDQSINGHDSEVKAALGTAVGAVNDHADANVATVTGAIDRHGTTVATEIGTAADALTTLVNGSTDNINAVTRQARDAVLGAIATATTTIVGAVTAAQAALAALIIGENGLLQVITAIAAGIAAVAGSIADALTILNFLRGGSATAHQTATADFGASPYLFAQPGDYYDVEIAAWPVRQGATPLAVGTWLPRLGWAAPLYGDVYGPQQRLNFGKNRVFVAHGATGVLIYTKAGVTGSARAYSAS